MKRFLLFLIGIYRKWISPKLPPACRFFPSCSAYTQEAIEVHGPLKGLGLGIWRVCRCNPFCKGGFDPVPPPKGAKQNFVCDSPQSPPSAIMPPSGLPEGAEPQEPT